MLGCSTQSTPAITSVQATSASSVAPTSVSAAASTGLEAKTLKVGLVAWFGWPLGLDQVHDTQVMIDMDNAQGGIDIGGEKYKIELVAYDSNRTQATEISAVNRLIFEDKVKFIMGDGTFISSWLQTAEDNKVVSLAGSDSLANLDPKWKYAFDPMGNSNYPVTMAWFAKKYPDLVKNFALALPDNQGGHFMESILGTPAQIMGAKMTYIYYPTTQSDLSSLGTKVKTLNPEVFCATGGGPIADGLAMTAAWQSGYRGQYFMCSQSPLGSMAKVMPAEALEGMINGAEATEFDPTLTAEAQVFKDAYAARYSQWDEPIMVTGFYGCLRAGLQAAGTTDTEKVAQVIGNGLKFNTPTGVYQMIARPDLGNERTVDAVYTMYFKTIKNGKAELIESMPPDQVYDILKQLQAAEATMTPS